MRIIILLLPFFLAFGAIAQRDSFVEEPDTASYLQEEEPEIYTPPTRPPYHPPPLKPLAARPLDQKQWDEASGGLDYSKDLPKPPKERKQRPPSTGVNPIDWTAMTQGLGSFFQALAVLAALVAIGFGIWRMLQAPRNRLIARDGVEITLANLDEYLHETDLERFLREALTNHNYAQAIRLYYLQIIKDLSVTNAIRWSREKTNRDYLREMKSHDLSEPFQEITRAYERVWYGNQALSPQEYARLEPRFKNLLTAI